MIRRLVFASLLSLALIARASKSAADGVSPTVISLPTGPGSVDGLGGNFEPSPSSGGASYNVAIHMPPAVAGLVPGLSLDHAGGAGASEIGIGWRLSLPAIRRRTEEGLPRFDDSDTFALSGIGGDGELVPLGSDSYRMRFEGAFVRVRRRGDVWEVRERSGLTHYFGEAAESMDGADGRAARWNMTRTVDLHGHEIRYVYIRDNARSYLTEIHYGGSGAAEVLVALAYEGRPDVLTSYQTGQAIALGRRLHSITISRGGQPVATYTLQYATDPGLSRLASVGMVGSDGVTSLPPVRWEYGTPRYSAANVVSVSSAPGRGLLDANNDLADVDGDGAADLLVTSAGRYTVYRNDAGHSFDAPYDMTTAPSVALSQAGVQLADMDGDAAVDLVAKIGIASDGFRFYPGGDRTAFGAPRLFSANPAFTFEDPDVRLLDLDFDRRTDVMITTVSGAFVAYNTGGTFTALMPVPTIDSAQVLRFSDPNVRLADLNGDRQQDIVYVRPGGVTFWPAKGRGLFDAPIAMRGVPMVPVMSELNVADINGDGLADLVHVGVTLVEIWLNQADGSFAAAPITINGTPEHRSTTAVRFADMNGNGTTDIVWVDVSGDPATAWRYLDIIGDAAPGQLTRIDNGLGHVTTISYRGSAQFASDDARAGHAWTTRLPSAMAVVSEVRHDDSLGSIEVTRFAYHNGLFSGARREFRGFGSATRTDVGDTDQPTLVTTFEFDLGQTDEARKGQTLHVTRADDRGGIFDRVDNTYDVVTLDAGTNGMNVTWSRQRKTERWMYERTATPKETRTETDYDRFGNVTATREWGLVDGDSGLVGNDERFTTHTYAQTTQDWILDRTATTEVADATGHRFAASRIHYDGDPFAGLPIGELSRGDVTRIEAWVGPAAQDWTVETSYQRDTDGNVIEQRDGEERRRLISWDPTTHAFPTSESVPFADGHQIRWSAESDSRFGNVVGFTGPNGERSAFGYDPLGRLIAIWAPGDSHDRPTHRYSYVANSPLSRVESAELVASNSNEYRTRIGLVSGRGVTRAMLVPSPHGGFVVLGVARYGARGWAREELRPFESHETNAMVLESMAATLRSRYDAVGRVVGQTLPDGAQTRTDFLPLQETHFDANDLDPASPTTDTPVVHQFDGLSRRIAVIHRTHSGDTTETQQYDPTGNMLRRSDALSVAATYAYDGLSRRTDTFDPDGGHQHYRFDRSGNMVAWTNARGQTTQTRYDEADRISAQDLDGDGSFEATFLHDSGCENPVGHLCATEVPGWRESMDYDARGQIHRKEYRVSGRTWTVSETHSPTGLLLQHVFPDQSAISFNYDARGNPDSIGDIVQHTDYSPDGIVISRVFGNGVTEQREPDERGRLGSLRYTGRAGAIYEDLSFQYNATSLLIDTVDHRQDRTRESDRSEHYEYDDLDHLTLARGTYGTISWRYDGAHRLLSRTSDAPAMNLGDVTYGDTTGPRPHAPLSCGAHSITWDADGNATTLDGTPLTWSAGNHPLSVPDGAGATRTENVYDAAGMRRLETRRAADGDHTTAFLSPFEVIRDGRVVRMVNVAGETLFLSDPSTSFPARSGCACEASRGTSHSPQEPVAEAALMALLAMALSRRRVAARLLLPLVTLVALNSLSCGASPSPLSIGDGIVLLRDGAGDTLAGIDREGLVTERDVRFPGGTYRSAPTPGLIHRYSGSQPQTSAGLAFIGPRVLQTALGLWLSVDPAALDGQAINPYTFADGDPIGHADRDGHWPSWRQIAGGAMQALVVVGSAAAVVGTIMTFTPLAPMAQAVARAGNLASAAGQALQGATGIAPDGGTLSGGQRALAYAGAGMSVLAAATTGVPPGGLVAVRVGGTAVAHAPAMIIAASATNATINTMAVATSVVISRSNTGGGGAGGQSQTPRAARREAMRRAGIPTSQQPTAQRSTRVPGTNEPGGRQYTYGVARSPGGGERQMSVQHSLTDRVEGHGPHWEAGNIRTDRAPDPLGRPRLANDKVRVVE